MLSQAQVSFQIERKKNGEFEPPLRVHQAL